MADFLNKRPSATLLKKVSNGNGFSSESSYDDVFGGPPKFAVSSFASRMNDYGEIFGDFSAPKSSSSIPVLDFPVVDGNDVDADVQSSSFNYAEVFGGFDAGDFAVSYEELFAERRSLENPSVRTSSGTMSSQPAATVAPADTSEECSGGLIIGSEKIQVLPNGTSPHKYDGIEQFSMLHSGTNHMGKEDVISGTIHIPQLDEVAGFTFSGDSCSPSQKSCHKTSCQVTNDLSLNEDSDGKMMESKHFRETASGAAVCGNIIKPSGNNLKVDPKQLESEYAVSREAPSPDQNRLNNSCYHMSTAADATKAFVTVSEISLRTQPSQLPPPSRPPPKLATEGSNRAMFTKTKSYPDESRSSKPLSTKQTYHVGSFSETYALEVDAKDGSPRFFDVEVDASSAAAASAAAMKEAMEKAQARLKSAKESMERKRDNNQSRMKLGMNYDKKVKEKTDTKNAQGNQKIETVVAQNSCERKLSEVEYLSGVEGLRGTRGAHVTQNSEEKRCQIELPKESIEIWQGKGSRATLGCRKCEDRTEDFKAEEQPYDLVKSEKFKLVEVPEQENNEKKPKAVQKVNSFEQKERKAAREALKLQNHDNSSARLEAHEHHMLDQNLKAANDKQEENEKKLKAAQAALEQEEYKKRLKAAQELHEQEENEKRLKVAREHEENEKRRKAAQEAYEKEENERRLKAEHEENEKRLKTDKEAREKEENEKRLKAAQEACAKEESEKRLKAAQEVCEKEDYEKRLKAAQEAHEKKVNDKRLKAAQEKEENERSLKAAQEAREEEENKKRLKVGQEARKHEEEQKLKAAKEACEHEEEDKKLKAVHRAPEHEELAKKLKSDKKAHEQEEKEMKLRAAQETNDYEENKKQLNGAHEHKEAEQRSNKGKVAHECKEHDKKMKETEEACEWEENGRKLKLAHDGHSYEDNKNSEAVKEALLIDDAEKELKVDKVAHELDKTDTYLNFERKKNKELNANQDANGHEERNKSMKAANEAFGHEVDEKKLNATKVVTQQDTIEIELKASQGAQHWEENDTKLNVAHQTLRHEGHGNGDRLRHVACEKQQRVDESASCEPEKDEKKPEVSKECPELVEIKRCIRETQGTIDREEIKKKKLEAAKYTDALEEKEEVSQTGPTYTVSQDILKEGKQAYEMRETEAREKEERVKKEKEMLRRIEEEREREREREKDRISVERATLEACDRASLETQERVERIAVERVTAEARQRALAEAWERAEKASAEAREKSKIRAERAAVERATAEARERAAERAVADARERAERSVAEKFAATSRDWQRNDSETDGSVGYGAKDDRGMRQSHSFSDVWDSEHDTQIQGTDGESAKRYKARLERYQRTSERAAKALAEKNLRDIFAQREQAERNRLSESLDAEVRRWSNGKEGNLRALLSTLHYILGPDSGWQPIPLTDVITAAAVKKAYKKATLSVHPDKLQQRGASIQQKYICEKVFDLLKDAWNKFNSEVR